MNYGQYPNFGFNQGYNTQQQQTYPIYQPQQQMPLQAQFNGLNNVQEQTIAYVNGLEGAKAFLIAPNTQKWLIDSEAPRMYLKVADNMGKANIFVYRHEPLQDEPQQVQASSNEFASKMQSFENELQKLRQEIELLKNNKESVKE